MNINNDTPVLTLISLENLSMTYHVITEYKYVQQITYKYKFTRTFTAPKFTSEFTLICATHS